MDVELNELHHIVLHTVVVLSLNNKQWATRPRRCTAAAVLRTWGRGAAPWPRGARFLARVTAEQLAHFPLDERWGFQLPGDMSAGQKYLCQLVKMCEKVKLEKKEKGTKKKKKEQWDEALGFQAKSYRPVVSVQRSRGPLGWARGVQIDEMGLMPIFSLLQQQQQKTVLLAQRDGTVESRPFTSPTLHY